MKKIYLDIRCANKKNTKGYILDISYNGIGIASSAKIRKNTEIEVVINEDKPLAIKGVVVSGVTRNRKTYRYRLGVRIKSVGKAGRASLDKLFLKQNERKAPRFPLSDSWRQD